MGMYLYTVERVMSSNYTMADIQDLNKLMTNSDNIHHLLGKLFNVNKEENWRSKYNILYRVDDSTTFKLIIKSDKEIDKQAVAANNCRVLSEKNLTVKNGDSLKVQLAVAPFRRAEGQSKKKIIKTTDERIAWLINKLTHNNECIVKAINEDHMVMQYMEHPDKAKGSVMLAGYNYTVDLTVKDADGFLKLMQTGIGPQKNYGFGLMV